jgi:alpha-galactosidase
MYFALLSICGEYNKPPSMKAVYCSFVVLCLVLTVVSALDNGLGRTPQLGWNSWNHFHCSINQTLIRDTAASIANSPLKAAGYEYINMDDCWAESRNSSGFIEPDPNAFPSGIEALASYVHSLGLKFGLYSDAGNKTCAGRPGSLGYEKNDALSYASWGVDYLKYDNCNAATSPQDRYPVMRNALNATGRHIFFSMCEWGVDNPATWAPAVGNSWRTTGDISDSWASMLKNFDSNNEWAEYAAAGGWNDPDMLEVGNGGMTNTEYTSHFSLWALAKAPLLIGCDVTHMSTETLTILTNAEVIAINQDPLGVQGAKVSTTSTELEVYAGPLSDKTLAVILLNRSAVSANITAQWAEIGLAADIKATVRDLWRHENVGTFSESYSATVEPHGVVMVKITPM